MEFHPVFVDAAALRWAPLPASAPVSRPAMAADTCDTCDTCAVRHLCLPFGLERESKAILAKLLSGKRRLRKGQKLYRQGEPFEFLYAARFGSFKTVCRLSDGDEYVSAFHLPGDLMGFDGMADGQHPTTVVALENAEACAIPYEQLMEACARSSPLLKRVSRLMGMQLVREYRSSKMVSGRHAEERVAGFLLQLSEWMKERGYSPREFQLRMSRADIGSYLGTTLETVSRSLSLFAREGFITVHSRRIQLVDPERLRICCGVRSG